MSDRWTPLSRVLGYGAEPSATFALVWLRPAGAPVARYSAASRCPTGATCALGPQSLGYVFGGRDRAS